MIIAVRNNQTTLEAQLDALLAQDYDGPYELIIVDNDSSDRTVEIAQAKSSSFDRTKLIGADAKRGVNYARNKGAKAAEGDLLAFCDGDDVVSQTWLSELVVAAASCDAVSGTIDMDLLNDSKDVAIYGNPQKDSLPVALQFLPYGMSANLGVWAEVLSSLGGWDEAFVLGGTEVDLCWRLQLNSYKLCFAPKAVVHYRLRPTLGGLIRQRLRHGRANVMLFRKYRSHGLPRDALRFVLRAWWRLLLATPKLLRSPEDRGRWLSEFAYRAGLIWGSLKYRTLFL